MNSVRKIFLIPVVALLAPALVACGGSKDKGSDADAKSSSSASSTPSASETPTETPTDTPTDAPSTGDGVVLHKDGFSVTLPAEASARTQDVPTKAGTLSVTLYLAPDVANGGTYVVAMSEYPAGASVDLDNAIKGAAANVGGKVAASQKGTYLGNPSRDAVITASASGQSVTVFGRFVQIGRKLFQLQYVVQKGDLTEPPPGFTDVVNSVKFD
jgi:hypothetical protein